MGYLNAVGKFGKQRTARVDGYTVNLYKVNSQSHYPMGKQKGLIYHWTAGTYDQCYDAYNLNIVFDPQKGVAHVVKTIKFSQLAQHLWGRNTGMVAITFCSMHRAVNSTSHAGQFPVTPAMLKVGAMVGAEVCAWYDIDPRAKLILPKKKISGSSLVTVGGQIEVPTVTDHATVAKHDGYFPDRWDVNAFMPVIQSQLLTHYDNLKSGKAQFMYKGIVKE